MSCFKIHLRFMYSYHIPTASVSRARSICIPVKSSQTMPEHHTSGSATVPSQIKLKDLTDENQWKVPRYRKNTSSLRNTNWCLSRFCLFTSLQIDLCLLRLTLVNFYSFLFKWLFVRHSGLLDLLEWLTTQNTTDYLVWLKHGPLKYEIHHLTN